MAVVLDPANLLAWELYHQGRLEGVGGLIHQLRVLKLTEFGAEELAYKLDVMGSTYHKIEADEIKAANDKADMQRRRSGRT